MVESTLKNKVEQLWLNFHSGGITNPLTVVEQISYLMFARMLDINETRDEKKAQRLGREFKGMFPRDKQHLRWGHIRNISSGDRMLVVVRDELFPFFKSRILENTPLGHYLKDAQCLIPNGNLLVTAVNAIHDMPLDRGDVKGDLYEYLLSKLTTAGIQGQFRTPRHIIRKMVEMLDPKPTDKICDPACGTAGFLVSTMEYLREKYSTEDLIHTESDGTVVYPGDLLAEYHDHIQKDMFYGFDFDMTMLRVGVMNLLLHGIESPNIHYQDTLSHTFTDKYPDLASNHFDVILANPPFKGSIDDSTIHSSLRSEVKTKKTELLFLSLMLRLLKMGGRCAVIVPDGVLFGASKAHVGVRKMLIDDNQLEGIVSLPSGVFKPYAGVSTAILIFTKGGKTDNVWFYDVQADGLTLDDKRDIIDENDLPDMLEKWKQYQQDITAKFTNRSSRSFLVPAEEIRENKYDLSINRYKEIEYIEKEYAKPRIILEKLEKLESGIIDDLKDLKGMVV